MCGRQVKTYLICKFVFLLNVCLMQYLGIYIGPVGKLSKVLKAVVVIMVSLATISSPLKVQSPLQK